MLEEPMTPKKNGHPATEDEIWDVLGWVDRETVAAIRHTGASKEEVQQAFELADEDFDAGAPTCPPLSHRVREVCGILHSDLGGMQG